MNTKLAFNVLSYILILSLLLVPVSAAQAAPGNTSRVSVASDGSQGNFDSFTPSISADGRYVTFVSAARNLVSGDTNGVWDIFVHDRQTGQTTRVSVASDGSQGNSFSNLPSISADGRYVAFLSDASNLVSGDTDGWTDIFVHDRQTVQTSRVSVASDGTPGNAGSINPSISADGRFVAFFSNASNLVSGDTNGIEDVFVHDRQTGQTTRVSVASDGSQGNSVSANPSISADGRLVAFMSHASNLVSGDTNNNPDIFIHDRQTGLTTRLSVRSNGTQANSWSNYPSISTDGRYVTFEAFATNLVNGDTNGVGDIFVHDRQTGQTTRVSVTSDGTEGDQDSYSPDISADGRYVAFTSRAANLVSGDTNGTFDIFVYDRQTGQTRRASVKSNWAQSNNESSLATISADGRYVAFDSYASSLVSGDTNAMIDIFVHENVLSDTVQFTISGYADEPATVLAYTDGTPKTATADDSGFYSFQVPYNWSGTVTPSKSGYEFSPASQTYSNLTADQNWQNYTAVPAVGPIIVFNTFLGGSATDFATAVTRDSTGNLYVAGKAYSAFGSPIRAYTGLADAVIAKYSASGALQWLTFLGGESYDDVYELEVDSTGNVYIFGSSHDSWGTPLYEYTPAIRNAFLAKLNAGGALQWNLFYSNSTTDGGIALDESGNVYAAGEFYEPYRVDLDIFVAKFNTNGALQWTTLLGSPGFEYWPDITRDSAGDLYVLGHSEQTWGTPVDPYSGMMDFFVAKLDSSGTLQWNTFLGGTNEDYGEEIAVDGNGNPYVIGNGPESWGSPLHPFSGGDSDFLVVRINGSTGALDWSTYVGGPGFDFPEDIKVSSAGTIYLSGSSNAGWGTPRHPYDSLGDGVVAVLDQAGTLQWNTFFGGAGDDSSSGIVLGSDDDIYLAGSSTVFWGSPLNPYSGGEDITLVKLGPPLLISGNAGVSSVTLSYNLGGPQTVTTDGNGDYSILVPPGWSGTVTPSKAGYVFQPASRTYSAVISDPIAQDYIAMPAVHNIEVSIGGALRGGYRVFASQNIRVSYPGINNGPVKIISTNGMPIVASERVAYFNGTAWTSFSELMGLPSNQLTTSYVLPWYNNLELNSQIRFGNLGSAATNVTVTVGSVVQGVYYLAPNQSKRVSYIGLNNGPVKITSSGGVPIIASMRVAYTPDGGVTWTSFSELMGLPASKLTSSYVLPWYNNLEMNTQLRFGNVGTASTVVTVRVGGVVQGTYPVGPNQSRRVSYTALNNGPVVISSSGGVPIIASERVAYTPDGGVTWTNFSELMGLPSNQLTTSYVMPWYNNVELNSQLRFGNVGTANTIVTVKVGGVTQGTYFLAPNQSKRVSYAGLNSGPVKITSSGGVPIVASERVAYTPDGGVTWPSFSELMGLPANQLYSTYVLPWYNNVEMNTQLRFGVP